MTGDPRADVALLDELEAARAAATPGPWEWEPETEGWGDCGPNLVTVAKLPPYSDGSIGPVDEIVGSWGHDANGIHVSDADAALIVAAVNHLPALIAAVRAGLALADELETGTTTAGHGVTAHRIRAALTAPLRHEADEEEGR